MELKVTDEGAVRLREMSDEDTRDLLDDRDIMLAEIKRLRGELANIDEYQRLDAGMYWFRVKERDEALAEIKRLTERLANEGLSYNRLFAEMSAAEAKIARLRAEVEKNRRDTVSIGRGILADVRRELIKLTDEMDEELKVIAPSLKDDKPIHKIILDIGESIPDDEWMNAPTGKPEDKP